MAAAQVDVDLGAGFHNAGLFFFLALTILRRSAPENSDRAETPLILDAAFAALSFGLHPLRVESVAWVTERRDVLSGFFCFLAMLAYLRASTTQPNRSASVTLPVVLLVLDFYPLWRLGAGQSQPGRCRHDDLRSVA